MADEPQEVEGQQPATPSTENQTTGEDAGKGEPTTPEEVPFHEHPRFKQLVEEKNKLKEDLEELKGQSPEATTATDDWSDVTPKQLQERTVKEMEKKIQDQATQDEQADREMETQFQSLRGLGHEISQEDEKTILKRMIEKDENVLTAFQGYSKEKTQQVQTQTQKTEGTVPPSKGTEPPKGEFSYAEIHAARGDPSRFTEEETAE